MTRIWPEGLSSTSWMESLNKEKNSETDEDFKGRYLQKNNVQRRETGSGEITAEIQRASCMQQQQPPVTHAGGIESDFREYMLRVICIPSILIAFIHAATLYIPLSSTIWFHIWVTARQTPEKRSLLFSPSSFIQMFWFRVRSAHNAGRRRFVCLNITAVLVQVSWHDAPSTSTVPLSKVLKLGVTLYNTLCW